MDVHKHTYIHHFNRHFPGNPGLASSPLVLSVPRERKSPSFSVWLKLDSEVALTLKSFLLIISTEPLPNSTKTRPHSACWKRRHVSHTHQHWDQMSHNVDYCSLTKPNCCNHIPPTKKMSTGWQHWHVMHITTSSTTTHSDTLWKYIKSYPTWLARIHDCSVSRQHCFVD